MIARPPSATLAELPSEVAGLVTDADAIAAEVTAELRTQLPPGVVVFDAHVHVGRDADGMIGDYDELSTMLDAHGVARAFAFCLNEADPGPGFRRANDRVLAVAERSDGRLVAFARLDLSAEPAAEARRCLDRGAGGIKLHPRAQGFGLDDRRLGAVFDVAAERRVPILIHGGPGMGGPTTRLQRLLDAYPGARLIVAHAGTADMAGLTSCFAGRSDVAFDTSTWSVTDVLDLLSRVSPQQVLHASDYPYGQQPSALAVAVRAARLCGLDDDELGALLGDSAQRLVHGRELSAPSPPRGPPVICRPVVLARIHQYLSMAGALLLTRRRDALGTLELAQAACDDDRADIVGLARIGRMVRIARGLWGVLGAVDTDIARRKVARSAIQLVQLADILAVTTTPAHEESRS